jgi:hypothetical protein
MRRGDLLGQSVRIVVDNLSGYEPGDVVAVTDDLYRRGLSPELWVRCRQALVVTAAKEPVRVSGGATDGAARAARMHGVDLGLVAGTGRGGRVTADDVTAYLASTSEAGPEAEPEAEAEYLEENEHAD